MSEVRPSIWAASGAACAAALLLIGGALGWWGERDAQGAREADADASLRASARVWPPRRPEPLLLPAPRPVPREPVTRAILRDLWDAEDAAARVVIARGLDGGLEFPEPPRRRGESPEAYRRRSDALRRQALADALLSHVRMRDYYASTELPQGMPTRETIRAMRVLPHYGPLERTEALKRATEELDANFGLPETEPESETGEL
jgi:hypothetical protein